ncbi:MAG: cellulose binding domain-containing protein [Acidimicrobiales bacterium]
MVDLHDSLRPSGAAPPLPVSEIAARGKRRKRRRIISTAGVAAATLSIAAIAISSLPRSSAETVTVADESSDETTDQTTALPTTIASTINTDTTTTTATTTTPDTTTTTADSADTDADSVGGGTDDTESTTSTESSTSLSDGGAEDHPLTTPGIRTSTTITSQWEDGYCMQIEVINETVDRDSWEVGLDLDGTIATLWNATVFEMSSGTFVFSGLEDYNVTIQAGAVTSFGACIDTDPS